MENLDRLSDAELLAATRAQPDAFAAFYERHARALLAYLARRTDDVETALDLTAEVFAAALEGCGRYRADLGPARAWLFGIANHKLYETWRRASAERTARRRLQVPAMEFTDGALERVEELVSAGEYDFLAGMERLSPDEREAVRARIIDERDYRDIAADARTSEAAIRQRVKRGLDKLARKTRRGAR